MNQDILKLCAAFVSQRMELGDTEWFFHPEILPSGELEFIEEQAGVPEKSSQKKARGKHISIEESFFPEESCVQGEVTDGVIADQDSLNELYTTVCGCMRCPLGTKRTKFVFGEGDSHADMMFIGEAPGADEDLQGRPFVGRAGQLLTKMINAMKLRRDDVYICNILKCRPPGNRDPKPVEIEKCEPILLRQIAIIKPKIICAVGRISGQTLLRTSSPLNALRGKVHDYHGVKFIVMYHPAALLRNPALKPAAWEDLKFLRREYDGMEL